MLKPSLSSGSLKVWYGPSRGHLCDQPPVKTLGVRVSIINFPWLTFPTLSELVARQLSASCVRLLGKESRSQYLLPAPTPHSSRCVFTFAFSCCKNESPKSSWQPGVVSGTADPSESIYCITRPLGPSTALVIKGTDLSSP